MNTDGSMFSLELTLENAPVEVVTEGVKDVIAAIKKFFQEIIKRVKAFFKKVFGKVEDSINDKEWNGKEPNRNVSSNDDSSDTDSGSSEKSSSTAAIGGSSKSTNGIGSKSEPLGLPEKKLHTYKDLVGVKLKEKIKMVNKSSLGVVDFNITDKVVMAMPYKTAARHVIDNFLGNCAIKHVSGGYSGKHFTEDMYQDELEKLKHARDGYVGWIDPNKVYDESDTIKEENVDAVLDITSRTKSSIVNKLNKTSQETIKQLNDLEKSVSDDLEKKIAKAYKIYGTAEKYEEADIAKVTSVVSSMYRYAGNDIYKFTVDAIGAVNGVIKTARSLRRRFDRLIHQLDTKGEISEAVVIESNIFEGFNYY